MSVMPGRIDPHGAFIEVEARQSPRLVAALNGRDRAGKPTPVEVWHRSRRPRLDAGWPDRGGKPGEIRMKPDLLSRYLRDARRAYRLCAESLGVPDPADFCSLLRAARGRRV